MDTIRGSEDPDDEPPLVWDPPLSFRVIDTADRYRWVGLTGTVRAITDHHTTHADIAGTAHRYHADDPAKAEWFIHGQFERQDRITFRLHVRAILDNLARPAWPGTVGDHQGRGSQQVGRAAIVDQMRHSMVDSSSLLPAMGPGRMAVRVPSRPETERPESVIHVLAGPARDGEALLTADLDLGQIARGTLDLDVVGHYARPDVFRLVVDRSSRAAVSFGPDDDDSSKPPRPAALVARPADGDPRP